MVNLFQFLYDDSETGKALYGDKVIVLIGITCALIYAWELYNIPTDDPVKHKAFKVYMAMIFPMCFTIPAAITKNLWFSRLGLSAMVFFKAYSNVMEWPHPGECTITVMLMGSVAMGVLANVSLRFAEKIARLLLIFAVGSYISIQSPHSVYVEDALPFLGGVVALSAFGLYAYHYYSTPAVAPERMGVHGARLVLSALFVHHTVVNLTSIPSTDRAGLEQISGVLRAVVIACIGAVATGTFQKEIQHKEQLEILVRKRTEEIQLQNKQLRMVSMALQASETAIAITDRIGNIVWINTAFKMMCHKKDEEELIGLPLKDLIYKLDPTKNQNRYLLIDAFEEVRSEGELLIGDSIFWLEATPFPENSGGQEESRNGGQGEIPNDRFLMVFKDVTASRAKELAEQKAHDEAMMAKAMGESMVTLTHELRTPLQGIMGVTSVLLQQTSDLNNDILESLGLIMASSSLLLNLINNLLDVKKANAKMMEEFPLSPISASCPIRDAVGFCLPLASISNVNIVADLRTAQHAIVKSNALRLQQVLINMISNAIKYTERGSDICVRIRSATLSAAKQMVQEALAHSGDERNGDHEVDGETRRVLVFSVSDCGSGIAPHQAGRLFRRYARLDTQPKRNLGTNKVGQPSGTGLGLHLCQLFVERMDGQIWATNNSNNIGSSFSFYLPLVSNEDRDDSVRIPTALSSKRPLSGSKGGDTFKESEYKPCVLLVDDTLINRKVIDRMLKKIGITKSVTVESGHKALEELSKNHFDLVITDLQMPGMSGTELSLAIKKSCIEPPPVVVGLTADTSYGVVQKCAESGMADVLYKPITLAEMREYFETTLPKLKPGKWYVGPTFNDGTRTPAQ